MAATSKKFKFPKRIFVYRDEPANDSPYLTIDESPTQEQVEDGQRVAVYELVGVTTKRVVHSLE